MGSFYSKEETEVDNKAAKKPKIAPRKPRKVKTERLPVVEEMFVQKVAYKCGITKVEQDTKKTEYLNHVQKNPERGFEDFTNLYKDLKRNKASNNKTITQIFRATEGLEKSPYNSMVLSAITALADPRGSSSPAILKYVKNNNKLLEMKMLRVEVRLALERLVERKEVVIAGGKKGDGLYKINITDGKK